MAALPEIPTFAEAGVQNVTAETWFAVFAPPGLPDEARRRLARLRRGHGFSH